MVVLNGEPSPKFQEKLPIVPTDGLMDVFVNTTESEEQALMNVKDETGLS